MPAFKTIFSVFNVHPTKIGILQRCLLFRNSDHFLKLHELQISCTQKQMSDKTNLMEENVRTSVNADESADSICSPENLQQVFIIFRHGARAPFHCYSGLPTTEDDWPAGMRHVTKKGKLETYNLGKYFRDRYSHLLTDDPREISATSVTTQRCFETLACVLAGMYPPKGKWVWNSDLAWQPIQIKTDMTDYEASFDQCLGKDATPVVSKPLSGKFPTGLSLFEFLHKESGRTHAIDMRSVFIIDCLFCMNYHGVKVPEWAVTLRSTFYEFVTNWFNYCLEGSEKKFAAPILKALQSAYKLKLEGFSASDIKVHLYCGSDFHLHCILKLISEEWKGIIIYGGSILFEHYAKEGSHCIKVLLMNKFGNEPQVIKLLRLDNPSSVKGFDDLLQTIIA